MAQPPPDPTTAELLQRMDASNEAINAHIDDVNERIDSSMEEIRTLLRIQIPRVTPEQPPTPSPHHSYSTRISKVDFPRFDGTNVRDWLYECDQFFSLDPTLDMSRVRLASIHLDGLSLQWHLDYMRQKFDICPTWNQYVADVTTRFGDAYEDPLSNLLKIKQGSKIEDYINEFELALTQVNLIPEHSLSIFLAGLEHTTQMHVRMFHPTTIAQATNLARLYEATKVPKTQTRPYSPASRPSPS